MKLLNLSMLILLSFCFIAPCFALVDLVSYTQAGNYVTPAYGVYLQGFYYYYHDGVTWQVNTLENYESHGYYTVLSSGSSPIIHATGTVKAGLSANILVCTQGGDFGSPVCQGIGRYTNVGNEQAFSGDYDLNVNNIIFGKVKYWIRLAYDIGGSADSYQYSVYYDIENSWKQKRIITLTSTSNFSEGVLTITLNSSQTNELGLYDIAYDNDGSERTLSGTLSSILFTDSSETKAYPYYIENWKGGFYNYTRNTTNTTVIKIFINENVTTKGILMFNNYSTYASTIEGDYNLSGQGRTDDNNNPFVIHQVFSDWRWNQSFSNSIFGYSTWISEYNRYANVYGSLHATSIYVIPKFKNDPNQIQWVISSNNMYSNHMAGYLLGNWTIGSSNNIGYQNLVNSSGTTYTSNLNPELRNIKFQINPNNTISYYESNVLKLNINESKTTFGNISAIGIYWDIAVVYSGYIYNLSNYDFISSANAFTNITNTSTLFADIGIDPSTPISTNINIIGIKISLSSASSGSVTCSLDNGEFIGSVDVPNNSTSPTYNLLLNFIEYNKTRFNDPNTSAYGYTCSFFSNGHNVTTPIYYTALSDRRIFLSNNYPPQYFYIVSNNPTNLSLNFPTFTDTLNFDYNFTNLGTNGTEFSGYYYRLTGCDVMYNNKCLKYSESGKTLVNQYFGICVADPLYNTGCGNVYCLPTGDYRLNPDNFSFLVSCMEYTKCYQIKQIIYVRGESYNNTIDRIVCYNTTNINQSTANLTINYCLTGACASNDSTICSLPVMTYANWGIDQDKACMNDRMKRDPLRYFGSVIYQTNILNKDPDQQADFVYGILFSLVFNFWIVILIIGIGSYISWREWMLSLLLMLMFTYFFAWAGWLGLLTPTLLTVIIILGGFIYLIKH